MLFLPCYFLNLYFLILIFCHPAFQWCLFILYFNFLFIRLYPSFQRVYLFLNFLESLRWVFSFSPAMFFYGLLMIDRNFVAVPWILQVYALELKHLALHFGGLFFTKRVKNLILNKYFIMHRKNIFTTIIILLE